MREYLLSVVCAAITVGIIAALVPEGEGGGLRRYVGLIGALCVVAILISPVRQVLDFFGGLSAKALNITSEQSAEMYEDEYKKYLQSLGERELSESIAEAICDKFDIQRRLCHVKAEIYRYDDVAEVGRVTVILSGSALLRDPYEIERFVADMLKCECTVVG